MKNCKCGREASYLPKNKTWLCDECAKKAGMLVPCEGEAHKNPFIDNCWICAPRWEWREVKLSEQDMIRWQLADQLETEMAAITITYVNEQNKTVDFNHVRTSMWAKLTDGGRVKKNSIRRSLY